MVRRNERHSASFNFLSCWLLCCWKKEMGLILDLNKTWPVRWTSQHAHKFSVCWDWGWTKIASEISKAKKAETLKLRLYEKLCNVYKMIWVSGLWYCHRLPPIWQTPFIYVPPSFGQHFFYFPFFLILPQWNTG